MLQLNMGSERIRKQLPARRQQSVLSCYRLLQRAGDVSWDMNSFLVGNTIKSTFIFLRDRLKRLSKDQRGLQVVLSSGLVSCSVFDAERDLTISTLEDGSHSEDDGGHGDAPGHGLDHPRWV